MNNGHELPKEYTEARDEWQKTIASIVIARRKVGQVSVWEWATIAARHAENIGIDNARELLGNKTYPNLTALDNEVSKLRRNEVVIVTRHVGLVEWLKMKGYEGKVVEHATVGDVLNKHVIGRVPLYLACTAASMTYISIPNLPESEWGRELSAKELDDYGAYMRTFTVREIPVIESY